MKPSHVGSVVIVHLESFPEFFLSFLGPKFLKTLYINIINSEFGTAFICTSNSEIIGFAAGVTNPKKFYRTMITRHFPGFGLAVLGAVLKRPSTVKRLYSRVVGSSQQTNLGENVGLLMSIGVKPEWQRLGAGSILLKAFLHDMKKRGIREVRLTTDKVDNDAVNVFYMDHGMKYMRNYETTEHRSLNEYMIDLENYNPDTSHEKATQ